MDFLLSQLQLLLLLKFYVLHVVHCFSQVPLGFLTFPFDYDAIGLLILQL